MSTEESLINSAEPQAFDRRKLIVAGGSAAVGAIATYSLLHQRAVPWSGANDAVFIARNQQYDGALQRTIRDGLLATGLKPNQWAGKRVLLKPNLVEPNRHIPHMTTHPAMIVAAAEVFRQWGAVVNVGEGPGHVRDTEMALVESGVQEQLDSSKLSFADLNYEEVGWVKNAGRASTLEGFFFPRSVVEADLIVSMPKLKTHHWVGFTAALKNLYGTIPGIKYGWPKNVLHHAGIPQTVFDINASLPKAIAIVDGIVCMEGDGPIMGSPKSMGLVVVGTNPTAVDATIARIMGLNPEAVSYLQLAGGAEGLKPLGPLSERAIRQCGERWQDVAQPFKILDVPHLRSLGAKPGSYISKNDSGATPRQGLAGARARAAARHPYNRCTVSGPFAAEVQPVPCSTMPRPKQTTAGCYSGRCWPAWECAQPWRFRCFEAWSTWPTIWERIICRCASFYAQQLAAGQSFDWLPSLYNGFYLTGEGQVGSYHPLHLLLYRWLPLTVAFDLELLLSYPLMLIGMYGLLVRRLGQHGAALFGGLVFTFSGFNLLHFVHPNAVAVVAHMPWLLWMIDVLLTTPDVPPPGLGRCRNGTAERFAIAAGLSAIRLVFAADRSRLCALATLGNRRRPLASHRFLAVCRTGRAAVGGSPALAHD